MTSVLLERLHLGTSRWPFVREKTCRKFFLKFTLGATWARIGVVLEINNNFYV